MNVCGCKRDKKRENIESARDREREGSRDREIDR